MYRLNPGKYLNPASNVVFKNLMKDSDNLDYLAKIISIVTKLDYDYVIDNIIIVDIDTLNKYSRKYYNTDDLIINIEDIEINISLDNNKINNQINKLRSYKHISDFHRINYKYGIDHSFFQICIENYDVFDNDLIINEVKLVEVTSGNYQVVTDKFKKFHINLKKIKEKPYNELTNEERYFKLLTTDDIEELNKIAGDDEIMKKVVNKLDALSHDDDILETYEKYRLE